MGLTMCMGNLVFVFFFDVVGGVASLGFRARSLSSSCLVVSLDHTTSIQDRRTEDRGNGEQGKCEHKANAKTRQM